MTNKGFHASASDTFCKIFFTFTTMGWRCGSAGQSVILIACITTFWLVSEAKFLQRMYFLSTPYLSLVALALLTHQTLEHGESIVKPDTGHRSQGTGHRSQVTRLYCTHHRFTFIYHVSCDKTNMILHASVAGTYCCCCCPLQLTEGTSSS